MNTSVCARLPPSLAADGPEELPPPEVSNSVVCESFVQRPRFDSDAENGISALGPLNKSDVAALEQPPICEREQHGF